MYRKHVFFCVTCKNMCKKWILHIGKGCTLVEWPYTSLGVNMKLIMSDISVGVIKRNSQLYIYIYILYILFIYTAYIYIVYIYKIYYSLLILWHRSRLRRWYFLLSPYLDSLWGSNPNPTPNPHLSNVSYLANVGSWGSIWMPILLDLCFCTFLFLSSLGNLFFSWTWGLWHCGSPSVSVTALSLCVLASFSPGPAL